MMKKRILSLVLVLATLLTCCVLLSTAVAETSGVATVAAQLATPKITSVSGAAGSVKISWGAVAGAAKYRVFYKTSSSGRWKKIADTTATSYTWNAPSGTYTFTVRCVNANGSAFTSDYTTTGTTYTVQLATPKITGVSGGAGNVKITWGAVTGAAKYRVFYKTSSSGSWKKIADTASTSYTWTGAAAGKSYIFTVRCVTANGSTFTSDYDAAGKSYTVQVATPQITSVTSSGTSVTVTWGKVTGAEKYRLFYKKDGKWTKLRDTTATSATITGGSPGKTYTYTVRCINSAATAYTSSYDATGKSITLLLGTPKITSVSGGAGSVKISWGAVSGAAKYRVFYKNGSSWKKIADTASTSYTWKDAKAGTKYTFTVRCVNAAGSLFTSNYDAAGKSYTVPSGAPVLASVSGSSDGVTVTWGKVSGAAKYRVFYKTSSGWKKIADTTSTSYTWKSAVPGTKYTFTVRCVSADGSTFTSDYDTVGKSITYVAEPKLVSVTKVSNGIQVKWNAVSGAAKYRVFYKVNGSGWKTLMDTTATSLICANPQDATKYTFTVRCVSADGSTFTSGYDATGKSITYYIVDAPANFKASYYNGNIRLTWDSVSNAYAYAVVYQVGNYDVDAENWQALDMVYTTYMDVLGGTPGVTYSFVVVAIDAEGHTSPYAHYTYTHR